MQNIPLPEVSIQALSTLLEIISDGVWDWNAKTGYVYRSPGWYTMLGYPPHSLENSVLTWEKVIHPDDYDRVMAAFDAYITHKTPSYGTQYRCLTKSGDYLWIEDRGKVVEWDTEGKVIRMIGAHRNIDAEKKLLEAYAIKNKSLEALIESRTQDLITANQTLAQQAQEAQRLATTDTLTNAANRYYFEKTLRHEIERAHRFNHDLSIIAMDIDHFKKINDQFGHATGDLVLIKLTQAIKRIIREIDLLSRWGGDELMIILPQTSLQEAQIVAEKIRLTVAQTAISGRLYVTSSLGVAQLAPQESSMHLCIRVDHALYRSKEAGRNTVRSSKQEDR